MNQGEEKNPKRHPGPYTNDEIFKEEVRRLARKYRVPPEYIPQAVALGEKHIHDEMERHLARWREQDRPLRVRELNIFRRRIPDERHPAWHAIFAACILRLELLISAYDNGFEGLAQINLDSLMDEINEVRSYIYALAVPDTSKLNKLRGDRQWALDQVGNGLCQAGFSYPEAAAILRDAEKTKSGGPQAFSRARNVNAYEMKQDMTYVQIAEYFGDCLRGNKERFRQGIRSIERLLDTLEQSRAQRERELKHQIRLDQQLRLSLDQKPAANP